MITYYFLASNTTGAVAGGTIGSILLIVIVALICCITIGVIYRKYCKRQNVSSYNTQQVELQTIRYPRTFQTTIQACQSRPTSVPSNQSRQPNSSVSLTSFETLTTRNPVVQTSRQQTSNIENCESSSDVQRCANNPVFGLVDVEYDSYY